MKKKIQNLLLSNKFHLFLLTAIVLLGFYLRIIGLNKTEGLWFDEMFCFYEAKQSFPFGIIHKLMHEDIHAPLYYFILHFWMKFLGMNDTIIRLLSVLFGVLTVPVAYFAGKEFSDKKTGLLAAALVSVNSLLIFYSQEVKHYSFQSLLGVISLLFLLKIKNNPIKKINYVGFILSSLAILYTFSIGFVFVGIEFVVFGVYLYFKNKQFIKSWILTNIITALCFLPWLPIFIFQKTMSSKTPINLFEAFSFSYANFIVIFQNWFSPMLGGLESVRPIYYKDMLSSSIFPFFLILAVIPSVIGLIGLIFAVAKKQSAKMIVIICLMFVFLEVAATFLGKFALLTRYTMLCVPFILVVVSFGLLSLKNKILKSALISYLLISSVFFIITSPYSAPRMPRTEGYKIVSDVLNSYNLSNKDILFFPWGGNFITKYYPSNKGKIVDFRYNDTFLGWKKESLVNIFDLKTLNLINRKNVRTVLTNYLGLQEPSPIFEKYIDKEVVNKLESGKTFVIVEHKAYIMYSEDALHGIIANTDVYKTQPLYYMLSSKVFIDLIKISKKHMTLVDVKDLGPWMIIVFKKN